MHRTRNSLSGSRVVVYGLMIMLAFCSLPQLAAAQTTTMVVVGGTILAAPPPPPTIVLTPPTISPISCLSPAGTLILTASVTGGNGNPATFVLGGTTGSSDFVIDPVSGALSVGPGGIPIADCGRLQAFRIGASQAGGGNSVAVISGLILPAPLVIVLTPPTPMPVACNAAPGTPIQQASTIRGDGNPITWSLSGTADFVIDSVTGQIAVAPAGIAPADCGKPFSYSITANQT